MLLAVGLLAGCASTPGPTEFKPVSINEVRFRDRAQSMADADVRVSAAVPSAEETLALFGADLYAKEIQPVWVKVENHSDRNQYLIVSAADPNHYSPIEAAYLVHGSLGQADRDRMENHFRAMHFRNPVPPIRPYPASSTPTWTKAKRSPRST